MSAMDAYTANIIDIRIPGWWSGGLRNRTWDDRVLILRQITGPSGHGPVDMGHSTSL
jgi:hypothetical protein